MRVVKGRQPVGGELVSGYLAYTSSVHSPSPEEKWIDLAAVLFIGCAMFNRSEKPGADPLVRSNKLLYSFPPLSIPGKPRVPIQRLRLAVFIVRRIHLRRGHGRERVVRTLPK